MMNLFEEIVGKSIKCEICGCETVALYGDGWDNDRIYCTDNECGAEYVFPTTTLVDDD